MSESVYPSPSKTAPPEAANAPMKARSGKHRTELRPNHAPLVQGWCRIFKPSAVPVVRGCRRFGHGVKCTRIWRHKLLAATPTAWHPRPRRPSTLNLQGPPSSLHVAGGCRPLRAHCEVRAHIAPGKLSAATPAAFHPRTSWAATSTDVVHPGEPISGRPSAVSKPFATSVDLWPRTPGWDHRPGQSPSRDNASTGLLPRASGHSSPEPNSTRGAYSAILSGGVAAGRR
jgi:hypothetical protein